MKFTNKIKIVVCFGENFNDHIVFYGKGNTEIQGDENNFIITGTFDKSENNNGEDSKRNID